MTLICIRQPGYFPYVGFFKKIQSSDIFVYLDDTKYVDHGWDNRNKIKTDQGSMWLSVPIKRKSKDLLKDVDISYDKSWQQKHLRSIELNYKKTSYLNCYLDDLSKIITKKWEKIVDLNLAIIEYLKKELQISTNTVRSSEMKINTTGSEKLLQICKQLDADRYLSGSSGLDYLNEKIFLDEKIKVIYENFEHPIYNQLGPDFLPNMSIIDLLFNEGEKSVQILNNAKNF